MEIKQIRKPDLDQDVFLEHNLLSIDLIRPKATRKDPRVDLSETLLCTCCDPLKTRSHKETSLYRLLSCTRQHGNITLLPQSDWMSVVVFIQLHLVLK